jgi:hypothetical protein
MQSLRTTSIPVFGKNPVSEVKLLVRNHGNYWNFNRS